MVFFICTIVLIQLGLKFDSCADQRPLLCVYYFQLRDVRHENVAVFIGCRPEPTRPALVYEYCTRQSLQVSQLAHNLPTLVSAFPLEISMYTHLYQFGTTDKAKQTNKQTKLYFVIYVIDIDANHMINMNYKIIYRLIN